MKIFLDSIGCRLNQAELEIFARQFREKGHELVADPAAADLAVINTCAVTSAADADSRAKIRQAAKAGVKEIIATGCWATLNPDAAEELTNVKMVITNQAKEKLVPTLLRVAEESFELESVERAPIPGARLKTRAFIKVQDGCNNRCTFCVTTIARGVGRSRSIPEVLADIRAAHSSREIVLSGVHLGSWGHDLSPALNLSHLVQAILEQTIVPRLRLSSLEPWDLDSEFFQLWENPRLCRHLHLPLQSGSQETLRRMARKTTPQEFAGLVAEARNSIPDIAITTDIITGFPGESETEFNESLAFVNEINFAGGHVFTYSPRPHTAAARLPNQVEMAVRKSRNAQMREILALCAHEYQTRFIGQVVPVLWENALAFNPQGWEMSGLTDNYLRVSTKTPKHLWNKITPVRLISLGDRGLEGQIQNACVIQ